MVALFVISALKEAESGKWQELKVRLDYSIWDPISKPNKGAEEMAQG